MNLRCSGDAVIKLISSIGLLGLLAGCGQQAASPPTVSWYVGHAEAMEAKVKWCADDAERRRTPDCMNAREADARTHLGSMKDEPALNWNTQDPKH